MWSLQSALPFCTEQSLPYGLVEFSVLSLFPILHIVYPVGGEVIGKSSSVTVNLEDYTSSSV